MLTSQSLHTMAIGLNTLCSKPGGAMADTLRKCSTACCDTENGRQIPPEMTHVFVAGRIFNRVPAYTLK